MKKLLVLFAGLFLLSGKVLEDADFLIAGGEAPRMYVFFSVL